MSSLIAMTSLLSPTLSKSLSTALSRSMSSNAPSKRLTSPLPSLPTKHTLSFPTSVTIAKSSLVRESSPTASEFGRRSFWRSDDVPVRAAWPNYKRHLTHRRHFHVTHTFGVQKLSRMRCVDNSTLGRAAMSEGRPPKVIAVYSEKHAKKPHHAYGRLGDRVLCAVKGEKVQGVIVGLKVEQLAGVPRFDSNNVVLLHPNGNPLGTRIHAPIPNCIRPMLKAMSHPKKADYTKLIAIATRFV